MKPRIKKNLLQLRALILLCVGVLVNMPSAFAAISDTDMSVPAIMTRLSPEGVVDVAGAAKIVIATNEDAARPERGGSEIYQSVCVLCHETGAAGAPIFGNHAAWAPRKTQGMAVLLEHALHGYNYMPPRGSCTDCTDSEIKEAIRYMLSKANV